MTVDAFVRLDHLESMLAMPLGSVAPPKYVATGAGPREELDAIVARAVALGPTYVLFSGGRDSSAVLALATWHARRLGLPDPIPVTAVYPEQPESYESDFQELVLTHLGLKNRVVLTIRDEQRFLGETAVRALRRHGLVWPASLQIHGAIYAHLDPGVLLTGEGGDEALGPRRITPVQILRRRRDRPTRGHLARAVGALVPNPMRRAAARVAAIRSPEAPWLRSAARAAFARASADLYCVPLRWDRETAHLLTRRATAVGFHNFDAQAREFSLTPVHPFADPRFRLALAASGGAWGYLGQTDLMRKLFSDLLPEAILSRRTKATFNRSRWGDREREFARRWDGSGVDPELVDAGTLRDTWLSERPNAVHGFYLHLAWLAEEGLDVQGRPAA